METEICFNSIGQSPFKCLSTACFINVKNIFILHFECLFYPHNWCFQTFYLQKVDYFCLPLLLFGVFLFLFIMSSTSREKSKIVFFVFFPMTLKFQRTATILFQRLYFFTLSHHLLPLTIYNARYKSQQRGKRKSTLKWVTAQQKHGQRHCLINEQIALCISCMEFIME